MITQELEEFVLCVYSTVTTEQTFPLNSKTEEAVKTKHNSQWKTDDKSIQEKYSLPRRNVFSAPFRGLMHTPLLPGKKEGKS